jgi:hypothetical protein
METFTYQDYFQECLFLFVPHHDLTLIDAYSQLQELRKISLLLRIRGKDFFVVSRDDIVKLQKYSGRVMERIEQLEIEAYRKKISKVFERYKETSAELNKFECDYFEEEIRGELLGEAEKWGRRFRRIVDL